jgi:Fur family ferric uptake transcriptional regulator
VTSSRITETSTDRALRIVRESGGRLTSPTRAVVAVLAESDEHLTADDLIAVIGERLPGVAPSTVYRVIQRLSELDLIEHVHTSIGPPIYHLREHGHAHLVCNGCGAITDIADDRLNVLRAALRKDFDFTLSPHHSALVGYCGACTAAAVQHTH